MTKEITVQARTWLGTPFVHQARLKGKGCDCLGLIVGVVVRPVLLALSITYRIVINQLPRKPDCHSL